MKIWILIVISLTASNVAAQNYMLPFKSDKKFYISQAFGGAFSHRDKDNYYAVDIAMPEKTLITAARAGKVIDIEQTHIASGTRKEHLKKANYIIIQHRDGTIAKYLHLRWASVRPRLNSFVKAGQIIAQSGNTGYSSGPHLHFVIKQKIRGVWRSIPFQFYGITPKQGMPVYSNPK